MVSYIVGSVKLDVPAGYNARLSKQIHNLTTILEVFVDLPRHIGGISWNWGPQPVHDPFKNNISLSFDGTYMTAMARAIVQVASSMDT